MKVFEFLLALYSIVAGLGLSLVVPAVHSTQAVVLLLLVATGVSFISLPIR